jgi:hypothetical protein
MLKLQPWLAQVNAAHTDLEFSTALCHRDCRRIDRGPYYEYFLLPTFYVW